MKRKLAMKGIQQLILSLMMKMPLICMDSWGHLGWVEELTSRCSNQGKKMSKMRMDGMSKLRQMNQRSWTLRRMREQGHKRQMSQSTNRKLKMLGTSHPGKMKMLCMNHVHHRDKLMRWMKRGKR